MGTAKILSEGTQWMDRVGLCSEGVDSSVILPGGKTCRVFLFAVSDKFARTEKKGVETVYLLDLSGFQSD